MIKFLLKTFVKDYEKTEDKEVRVRYGVLGGILGIVCNLFLFSAASGSNPSFFAPRKRMALRKASVELSCIFAQSLVQSPEA